MCGAVLPFSHQRRVVESTLKPSDGDGRGGTAKPAGAERRRGCCTAMVSSGRHIPLQPAQLHCSSDSRETDTTLINKDGVAGGGLGFRAGRPLTQLTPLHWPSGLCPALDEVLYRAVFCQGGGWPGQPAPSLPGARATPAQPASGGGCLLQPRWAVCATGAGAHQGQTSREGEKDIWWTAGTALGGTGHLGLTHTETQRGRLDGLWTEAHGQQKQSNEPGNNQCILNTLIIGRR